MYFPGLAAKILLHVDGSSTQVGSFGVLHPDVLRHFSLTYPAACLEMTLEHFV
jgi:phenylalanyl-tRNA synthetase beta subunit